MAFNYSPKIITDGLVLYLDAANTRSYPGSGTTWTDLSRGGNTGTLINGPTFNSGNGGNIVFDGTNDLVNINNIAFGTNPFSICLWFKINQNQNQDNSLIAVAAAAAATNWQLSFINSTQLVFFYKGAGALNSFNLNTTFSLGVWYNVCITKDTSNDIKSYINGIQTATVNYAGNYTYSEIIRLGLNRGGTAYYNGQISTVNIYNNVSLTATEIRQNYNATKTRFGII
jgi:hypothetical protein